MRIDDRFAQHPKVATAGPLAMAMQVAALGYCNRELTDGLIPRSVARTLIDCDPEAGITVTCGWIIARLIDAGIWEEVEGGYHIHDFLEYQPSKEQVLKERGQTLKRVHAFRERNAVTNTVTPSVSNAGVTPAPVTRIPLPVSVSQERIEPTALVRSRGPYTDEFEKCWKTYPPVVNNSKLKAWKAWNKLTQEERASAVASLPAFLSSDGWRKGFAPHTSTFLNGKLWQDVDAAAARASPNGVVPHEQTPEEIAEFKARMRELQPR